MIPALRSLRRTARCRIRLGEPGDLEGHGRYAAVGQSNSGVRASRRDGSGEANVNVRGVSPQGISLRPQVTLVAGRWFSPGKREVVISRRMASRFANFEIGGHFKASGKEMTVAGVMDGVHQPQRPEEVSGYPLPPRAPKGHTRKRTGPGCP